MRHIFAWLILVALVAPVTLLGQARPPASATPAAGEPTPDWLATAIKGLVRDQVEVLAAAKVKIVAWLTDTKASEDARLARVRIVLNKMTEEKKDRPGELALDTDRRNEVALVVAEGYAFDRTVSADVRVARIKELFKELAKAGGPFKDAEAERVALATRTAARDVLIALVTGPGRSSVEVPAAVADIVGEYLASKDPVTLIDTAMIVAKARSMLLVASLIKGLDSPAPAVRYWSAKGLADAQAGMYELAETGMNGATQLESQMKALADHFAKEDSPPVMLELFRALGATDAAKMTDARRNQIIYKAFSTVFRKRLGLLGQGNLSNLDVDVAGLASAGQWEQAFRSAKALRAEILGSVSQMLWWAFDIYSNQQASLSEGQKSGLEHVMLKSAEVIGGALTAEDLQTLGLNAGLRQDLMLTIKKEIDAGNVAAAGLKILDWVGQPGEDYLLMKLGIPAAQKLPAPVAPPATSAPAAVGT